MAEVVAGTWVNPRALAPGTEVGRWRIRERLGVGGYAAVYAAESLDTPGLECALKLALSPDDGRAEREVVLLRQAVHPNIVRVLDGGHWGPEPGHVYLALERVRGVALHEWAETLNPSLREVVRVARRLATTLEWLHARGMIHRDLKPEHILVRREDGEPVLIDFNAADLEGAPTLTSSLLPPTTFYLLSPEAVDFFRLHHGERGVRYAHEPKDDLYSLGVCLFRAMTGHYPFPPHLPNDMLMLLILSQSVPWLSDFNPRIPEALSGVLARLLKKRPEDRFTRGAELDEALGAVMAQGSAPVWDERLFAWEEPADPTQAGQAPRRIQRPTWPVKKVSRPASAPSAPEPLPLETKRLDRTRRRPPVARPREGLVWRWWLMGLAGLLLTGLAVAAGRPGPPREPGSPPRPPAESSVGQMPSQVVFLGQELAFFDWTRESDPTAVPPLAVSTPAVAARAANAKDMPDVKTSTTTANTRPLSQTVKQIAAVAATTCALATGCASAPPPVPSRVPGEECPEGALDAMEKLGIELGSVSSATLPIKGTFRFVSAREGPVTLKLLQYWGDLQSQSVLTGRMYFRDRGYGRLTRVVEVDTKKSYPVCFEYMERSGDPKAPSGVELRAVGEDGDGTAQILSTIYLRAVPRFDY